MEILGRKAAPVIPTSAWRLEMDRLVATARDKENHEHAIDELVTIAFSDKPRNERTTAALEGLLDAMGNGYATMHYRAVGEVLFPDGLICDTPQQAQQLASLALAGLQIGGPFTIPEAL